MRVLWRLVVIVFAFLLASMAAGIVITLAVLFPTWSDFAIGAYDEGVRRVMLTFGLVFVSGFALLPAVLIIALAEAFAFRSVLYYALGGAVIGFIVFASLGTDLSLLSVNGFARRETEIMIGAGIIAGLVYWLVAGRRAGLFAEPARRVARPAERDA